MGNIIEVQNVSFRYKKDADHYDVNQVTFHVKHGEWLSIVGHNGSGKSTTVRLLDGLLEAETGQIWIDGEQLTLDNVWEKRHQIGMVFQNPDNQFVGATVEDDIAFGLENQGIPREEMKKRVEEALDLVGMTAFKTKEPARLSGGQKQRVAIAGVVAMRPDILILDEATSMLDPEGRKELIQAVQDIRKEYQMTVISITHDLDEVALSDRVIVMKQGKIESSMTPRDLFSRKDLDQIGLDEPFENQLRQFLLGQAVDLPQEYVTERELEDRLWELL